MRAAVILAALAAPLALGACATGDWSDSGGDSGGSDGGGSD